MIHILDRFILLMLKEISINIFYLKINRIYLGIAVLSFFMVNTKGVRSEGVKRGTCSLPEVRSHTHHKLTVIRHDLYHVQVTAMNTY